MNMRNDFDAGQPPQGSPYHDHPLVLAIRSEMDRGDIIRKAIVRSLKVHLFILFLIAICVGINLFLYVPTTLVMLRALFFG